MSDRSRLRPRQTFGAFNPILIAKPNSKSKFIDYAQQAIDDFKLTPSEKQTLSAAVYQVQQGELSLSDWPSITDFLKIVRAAMHIVP